jgi:hypothetical protein
VKYIVRMNIRAFNPLTMKMDPKRIWEVEQCANKDSARVIWHCDHVRIRHNQFGAETPIEEYLATAMVLQRQERAQETAKNPLKKEKAQPIEFVFHGILMIGGSADNAFIIQEGKADVFA